ncbi:hypothetical protein [Zooshikella sp. RANM57]|uniref:hypothetical protein n=1 Tax=Zooshikella sp. RANM57 TaxID=3425863 RepID=UPI003D6E6B69
MKFYTAIYFVLMLSGFTHATQFWTVRIDGGIHTSSQGAAALNTGKFQPSGPIPRGTQWVACKGNWIYFHKNAKGQLIDERFVDRMLSVAISAFKTKSYVRVALERDSKNNCYTSQIFDLSN